MPEETTAVIKLLTLPISNAPIERAFSHVMLLTHDTRNRMGLPLMSTLMDLCARV